MISKLAVRNFRSVENANVDLGPITVFFGPTSAGKSSLFYALLMLRNFILNPNQVVDGFFNLGFQNLGGFEACVFNHDMSRTIGVDVVIDKGDSYGISLGKTTADIHSNVWIAEASRTETTTDDSDLWIEANGLPIPYAAAQMKAIDATVEGEEYSVSWNGFAVTVTSKSGTPDAQRRALEIAERVNRPVEAIRRVDICPHKRGFFKSSYSPVAVSPTPTAEDEVASLIINDPNAPPRISINTTEIFDRDFRTYTAPGTATTFLQTTEQRGARVPGYLVNDGFGVNQVVYMLAKIHRPEARTILIEEPEVHLHPTVVREFARVLVRLAHDEDKQLVFTTHSEQFLLSLLACVKERLLAPSSLKCYYASRERRSTVFALEPVSDEGQISGGLSSFVEAELKDVKTFLSMSDGE